MKVAELVHRLQLQPHPEGGYFAETYRAPEAIPQASLPARFGGDRAYSTAIYFLVPGGTFSAFHRIAADETWHHYLGGTLRVHCISPEGQYHVVRLGKDLAAGEVLQYTVPQGTWFASEPAESAEYALVGCTVAPGFDFADFELADRHALTERFPQFAEPIARLTRLS